MIIKENDHKTKSNLYHTRGIIPKLVTTGGINFRGLAPGQHSPEETPQQWRAVNDTVSDLTNPGIEPRIIGDVFNNGANWPLQKQS